MKTYDYRINPTDLDKISQDMERLSNWQFLKLAEMAQDMQEEDAAKYRENTKTYFNTAIIPCLENFAKVTESLLTIEEYDDSQTFHALFRNPAGFLMLENSQFTQLLFFMAEGIEISLDGEDVSLKLTYSF